MTITEFLLARIAEDEERARAAHYDGQQWIAEEEAVVAADRDWDPVMFLDRKKDAAHAANWSPARVLAECEAKRCIVELHAGQVEHVEWFDAPGAGRASVCPSCRPAERTEWHPEVGHAGVRPEGFVASYVMAPCPTLRALAAVYSDHPDYDPIWRP